ncbi:MAG: RNA methyltransferase [Thermoleophilaceae bacterium]
MITSPDNDKLKTIRKLQQKSWRTKLGLFAAEGEDLQGPNPEFVLTAGTDVEPELLDAVSTLGSGTRVIGVYSQRWAEPQGDLLVYLHGVEDPGNVGTIIRSAHALADAMVVLGPHTADPYSPKAVRASMGSIFARPPARAELRDVPARPLLLDSHADRDLRDVSVTAPLVLCFGSERGDVPDVGESARIPVQADSLNVAMAATVALYEVANRMAADG